MKTMSTRERNLRQLKRVIRKAPAERLHMKQFPEPAKCGTAYCAAGWAAVDPWFQENTEIKKVLPVCDSGMFANVDLYDLALVFDLSTREAKSLFAFDLDDNTYNRLDYNPHYITKKDVLANIDRLIRGEAAVPYM